MVYPSKVGEAEDNSNVVANKPRAGAGVGKKMYKAGLYL